MRRPRNRIASLRLAVTLLAALAWLSSCAKKSAPGPSGEASGGASLAGTPAQFYTPRDALYEVKYTPNTVRVDLPTVQKTLRAVSPDGNALVFDSSDPRLQGLTAGKVLFLEHLGVRRVIDVEKQGSQVGLITDAASLSDFIQDGHIKFTAPMNRIPSHAEIFPPRDAGSLMERLGALLLEPRLAYADTPNKGSVGLHAQGKVDDWEFEASATRKSNGVNMSLSATKDLGGLKAKVTASGDVSGVSSSFDATADFRHKWRQR
ncbi:MAG TPA: hypothetical protein VFD93_07990 [Candidatus Acidoferrales bacterium]|nr:hypothetical protein [Candidatus Acidoferrales bacterium]